MDKRTFTDNMKACGCEPRFGLNGNITATKGDNTVRLAPLADHGAYIGTPILKAMTRKDAADTETPPPINLLAARPSSPSGTRAGSSPARARRHIGYSIKEAVTTMTI